MIVWISVNEVVISYVCVKLLNMFFKKIKCSNFMLM